MSLRITDKELEDRKKQLGYEGCKNCQHQIEPLRMCEWGENGGDGRIHLICPRWDKKKQCTKGAEENEDLISRADALKALDYDIKHFVFKKGVSKYMDDIAKLLDTIYTTQSEAIKTIPSSTSKQPENGDTIPRIEVNKVLIKWSGSIDQSAYLAMRRDLLDIPSAQPMIKRGHWIHLKEDYLHCERWECSRCHKTTMTNPMYPYNDYDHMYYCPKCGAKMGD